MAKVKPTKNKTQDTETKLQIEKLWAQYGRLQAEREQLAVMLQKKVQQMRNIQNQIMKLEERSK